MSTPTEHLSAPALTDMDALRTGAALLPKPDAGALILTDNDRADFLHRMSTNDINGLRPGHAVTTVLTSPTARTLFVFTVLARPDDLLLLPASGRAAALAKHLRGQIFFMDAVKVADAGADLRRMRLMGPEASAVLTALGLDLRDAADETWVEADGIIALRQTRFDVPGIELIVPTAAAGDVTARLTAAGAHLLTGSDAYHVRRVELGRPAPGAEITEDFNPLESGLAWACADNKGCYTGQEIIARQLTYDKVTKTLVGLVADQPLAAGDEVTAEERTVGSVTSAVFSPHLQRYLGLAVIKRPYNADATVVDVAGTPAVVTTLPFSEG